MINPNELRIGNLLMTRSEEPEIISVDLIDSIESTICGNGLNNVQLSHLSPIQLTPEILENCGFNRLTEKSYNGYKASIYSRSDIAMSFYLDDGILTWGLFPPLKIQYLHQFQNLYFSLTGKELDVSQLFQSEAKTA